MEKAGKGTSIPTIDGDGFNLIEVPNETGTPERRLLLAILERAILDFVGNEETEVAESEVWLFGDLDAHYHFNGELPKQMFSFSWICDQLDLDTASIARKIKAMPKRGNHRIAPWHLMKSGQLKSRAVGSNDVVKAPPSRHSGSTCSNMHC
jgi:hypothetical protein